MRVLINDLGNDDKPYWASSSQDCKDATDRSAYESAIELGEVITMGKVVACPERFLNKSPRKPMWKCQKCFKTTERLEIHWGMSGGEKVDVLDFFCPHCPSGDLKFLGTRKEEEEYWEKEWSK